MSEVLQRWIDQKSSELSSDSIDLIDLVLSPSVGSAYAVHYCAFIHSGGLLISEFIAPQTPATALTVNKPAHWHVGLNVKLVFLREVTR